MREFNLFENCEFFASGNLLFERSCSMIDECYKVNSGSENYRLEDEEIKLVTPIDVMILDYQMP